MSEWEIRPETTTTNLSPHEPNSSYAIDPEIGTCDETGAITLSEDASDE